MKYQLYFELFSKKMQVVIEANTEQDAEYLLRGKIKVNKIVPVDEVVDNLKDILGIKTK